MVTGANDEASAVSYQVTWISCTEAVDRVTHLKALGADWGASVRYAEVGGEARPAPLRLHPPPPHLTDRSAHGGAGLLPEDRQEWGWSCT